MFNDAEVQQARNAYDAASRVGGDWVRAIMECAAHMLAARGGTMTAERMAFVQAAYAKEAREPSEEPVIEAMHGIIGELLQHGAALGARVAVLEKQIVEEGGKFLLEIARADQLEQRVSDLEKSLENARKERDAANSLPCRKGECLRREADWNDLAGRCVSLEHERDEWREMAEQEERRCNRATDAAREIEALGRNFEEACQKAEVLREQLEAERESNRELVRRAQAAEAEVAKRRADCALTEADLRDSKADLVRERETILRLRTEVADLREQQRDSTRRLATLSAAGEVLSEHADKTAGGPLTTEEVARNAGRPLDCAGEADCGWHVGGACSACRQAEAIQEAAGRSSELASDVIGVACDHGTPLATYCPDCVVSTCSPQDAYKYGSEAMRAACWEAVQEALGHGFPREGWQLLWELLKDAIDGATP